MAKKEEKVKKTKKAVKPAAKVVAKPKKGGFPAKGSGKKTKKKSARAPLPLFKAPADFKPHFLLVTFATAKDGLLSHKLKATRFQGKFDRDADDKKKFELGAYDPETLLGIAARIAGVVYKASNDKKFPLLPKAREGVKGGHRLPPSTIFQVLLRVGKRSADQSLTTGVKEIWQVIANKKGRMGPVSLEKTDPVYRAIRKSSRTLPAAFANVQAPPKRGRKTDADEE